MSETLPTPTAEPERPSLLGLPRERLAEVLAPHVDRRFRIDQIYRALYERGVESFDQITDLSKSLRAELDEHFSLALPEVATEHVSTDGTIKYLFRLGDGATIETVDIPDRGRHTFCLSSQAGCALACRFCVTGYWGAGRDLSSGEILGQILRARRRLAADTRINLVFMGMGEPLLNLGALRDALDILFGLMSWRRITVSTSGIVPALEEMARWEQRPQLAISLHAPDDARRDEIMPINRKYPLAELFAALDRYPLARGQRITYEYILIRDFNDSTADADLLVRLLGGRRAKVNLIPLNEDPVLGEDMREPDPRRVEAFRRRLVERGVAASTRARRGDDVSAACGQLRAPGREPRGFRRSNLSL